MMMPMSWGHQTGAGAEGHPWAPSGEIKSSAQGCDRGEGRAEPRMASGSWCRGPAREDDGDDGGGGGTVPISEDEAISSGYLGSAQLPMHLALGPHELGMGVDSGDKSGGSKCPLK